MSIQRSIIMSRFGAFYSKSSEVILCSIFSINFTSLWLVLIGATGSVFCWLMDEISFFMNSMSDKSCLMKSILLEIVLHIDDSESISSFTWRRSANYEHNFSVWGYGVSTTIVSRWMDPWFLLLHISRIFSFSFWLAFTCNPRLCICLFKSS